MNVNELALRLAGDTIIEHKNIPMKGKFTCNQKGGSYAILEVPEGFVEPIYKAIQEDGMQKPDDAPHISVMTDEELEEVGKENIEEDGQEFGFTLGNIESCDPEGWDEMEKVVFVQCKSPELEALRKKYGLTPLVHGDHDFHITLAVVPKKGKAAMDESRIARRVARSFMSFNEDAYEKEYSDIIEKAIQSIEHKVEEYEPWKTEIEEIESKARSGFIPYHDGGWMIQAFTDVRYLEGSGYGDSLPPKAKREYDRIVDYNYEEISKQMKQDFPEQFKDVKHVGYNEAEEAGLTSEYDNVETAWFEDDSIMYGVSAFYDGPERGPGKGKNEMYVFAYFNFDAPYHRMSKSIVVADAEFTFTDAKDLQRKLRAAVNRVASKL